MILLLDTQALIWYLENDPKLSAIAKQAISAQHNIRYVSIASFWEMSIKSSLGKLQLTIPLNQFFQNVSNSGFFILGIFVSHTVRQSQLPSLHNHKDRFARMIASQCLVHGWSIISSDPAFDLYGIHRVW